MSEFFGQEVQIITVSVPVGTMVEYAGDTAPNDWMLCDGRALNKSTYSALHAVLGTKFGSGDGSGAEFNVPDCRDRVTVGQSATKPVGATGGAAMHKHGNGTLGAPDHLHAIPHSHHMAHYHGVSGSTGGPNAAYGTPAGSYASAAGGAHAHSLSGGTDWGTRNDTDGPSVGTTQASDRPLSLVGDMDDQSTMQPYVVCTKIIKVV